MSQKKLTVKQVRLEYLQITGDYLDAKEVIKAKQDERLGALRERCPHETVDDYDQNHAWCIDCEKQFGSNRARQ